MMYFAVLLVGSQCPSALHGFVSQSSQSWLNRLGCAPRGQNYPPLDTEAMLEDGEVVKLVHRVAVALSSAEAGEFWWQSWHPKVMYGTHIFNTWREN